MDVALKVDVDTRAGMAEGVPRLREMLGERGIPATFFITFGPDNSGKAIRRVFRPGFVRKMLRTRAVRMYGWKTMLYGTLLPAPRVGSDFPEILRGLAADGHEVGLHAWDHVRWHDTLHRMTPEAVAAEFGRGIDAFTAIFGAPPLACAAPGWTATGESLRAQDRHGLLYHSDSRGTEPFLPVMDGYPGQTPQIPTTLPTLDEILGTPELGDTAPEEYLLAHLSNERLNVFTLHAEAEGMGNADFFAHFLDALRSCGAHFLRLRDVELPSTLPRRTLFHGHMPGRAGTVACQGTQVEGISGDAEHALTP
jgi:peptidoglycan/xylan/chitin deacetylase (PgdA/CDA1 family)